MLWDAGKWWLVVEARYTLKPTGGDWRRNSGRGLSDERDRLLFQEPEPFTPRSESAPHRFDAERLFCCLKWPRMGDALSAAEQPSLSGHVLKLGDKYGAASEPLSEELGHNPGEVSSVVEIAFIAV
jgi:hypothetical protein